MAKNLFSEPFDDGTKYKLRVVEDYFKSWLPVFISSENAIWKKVQIFDFFAGMGKDENGLLGSPMLIVSELNKNKTLIEINKIDVRVVVNDFLKKHYEALKENLNTISDDKVYVLEIENQDFKILFDYYYSSMASSANFLFLDQNGVRHVTEEVFLKIIGLKQTDFIFFISSSYIKRFSDSPSFKKYLDITSQDLEGKSYYHIHRIVLEYYRSKIPAETKYYLAPFSIKKPTGIYGLIFGSNHIYGLEKFLNVCWRHDHLTGEANFDIDNEKIDLAKPSLFEEYNVPKKIQVFQNTLKNKILTGYLRTDLDIYTFGLKEGFLPKHVNAVIEDMRQNGLIDFKFKKCSNKVHKIQSPTTINLLK